MRKHGIKTTARERLDLPALRQRRGISLREIADSTKISIRFLQAIEPGDFQQLPGGIYTSSYLRQYAREIGFEEATLLAYYQALTVTASWQPLVKVRGRRNRLLRTGPSR